MTTPVIDTLVDRARAAGAEAASVCGAGGGGCLLVMALPAALPAVRETLAEGGARLLDFTIEADGLRVG